MYFTQKVASDILEACRKNGVNPFQGGNSNLMMYVDRGSNIGGGYIQDSKGRRIFYPGTAGVDMLVDLFTCSIERILKKIPNKRVFRIMDCMSGSNTTYYAVQELRKRFPYLRFETYLYDLRPKNEGDVHVGGFDAVKGEYECLYDIIFIHFPYGPMYEYSKIWGEKADSRDISIIPQESFYTDFIPRANKISWNAFRFLSQYGELISMSGDRKVRNNQEIFSMAYNLDLYGQVVALPMKIQVNASSNRTTYNSKFMYQVLEYISVCSNPDSYQVKVRRISFVETDLRNSSENDVPWMKLIESALRKLGGAASISQIYDELRGCSRAVNNRFVREKIRQELRRGKNFTCLSDGSRDGIYGLSDLDEGYLRLLYYRVKSSLLQAQKSSMLVG